MRGDARRGGGCCQFSKRQQWFRGTSCFGANRPKPVARRVCELCSRQANLKVLVVCSSFLSLSCDWISLGKGDMARNLDKMSFKQLQELELQVKKAKATVQDRSRAELRQKLEVMASN